MNAFKWAYKIHSSSYDFVSDPWEAFSDLAHEHGIDPKSPEGKALFNKAGAAFKKDLLALKKKIGAKNDGHIGWAILSSDD